MVDYNASDTRQIRAAAKLAKAAEESDARIIRIIMGSTEGRAYIYKRLERAFIFHTPFTGDNNQTNFNLGTQNAGLIELAELMRICPNDYVTMMHEASQRNQADGRRTNNNDRRGGRSADADGRDSAADGRVESEYEPGSGVGDDAADGEGSDQD